MIVCCSLAYVTVALQAYDEHLNMVLGEVEEVITQVEADEETLDTIVKVFQPISPSRVLSRVRLCASLF